MVAPLVQIPIVKFPYKAIMPSTVKVLLIFLALRLNWGSMVQVV